MLDKYKRYLNRRKDGRIGVKLNFQVFLRRVRGLPKSLKAVDASLQRAGKGIELGTSSVEEGIKLYLELLMSRYSLQICTPTQGQMQGQLFGGRLLRCVALSTKTQCKLQSVK